MPLGFKHHSSNGKFKVLHLKITLYGLCHAFWKYNLTKNLGILGLLQAPFDPCLFIGKKVIAICYVNDLISWAIYEMDVFDLAN